MSYSEMKRNTIYMYFFGIKLLFFMTRCTPSWPFTATDMVVLTEPIHASFHAMRYAIIKGSLPPAVAPSSRFYFLFPI